MICSLPGALLYLLLLLCPTELEIELDSRESIEQPPTSIVEYERRGLRALKTLSDEHPEDLEVESISQSFFISQTWLRLAECESGNWIDDGRDFESGSARWDWAKPGTEVPPWGTRIHHGGLQFHPDTWSWVAPMVGLGDIAFAYDATPEQQVEVAEKVLELQGWQAWPVCSRKLGYR